MHRAHAIAVGCLALLSACPNPSTNSGTPTTSTTVAQTATTTTILRAPTDCREAPQMPACRPGHGIDN